MSIGPVYRCLLEVARERGVDTEHVLAGFGFTEQTVLAPDARLAPDIGRALAAKLVVESRDPELGLAAAERFRLADMDLLGYVVWHSTSLSAMFDSLSQYARLLGDTAECSVTRVDDSLTIKLGRGRLLLPEACDFMVGVLARLVREWSHGAAELTEVQLPRGRPRHPEHYERFFGAPVQFDAEMGALTYREPETTAMPPEHDPQLGDILRRQADRALAGLPRDASLVVRAREYLSTQLDKGDFDLGSIATLLGTSERTLRRRLRELGTGYRELIDDVRRERALMLAHDGAHNVTNIAMQVGFADVTTFTRAFRRWTGSLPSNYMVEARARASDARMNELRLQKQPVQLSEAD